MSFQLMPKNIETQSWVMKTVWQRIPGRRAHDSKTPMTTAKRSSSADWRTADVDDICNCSSCTAEMFHEDIGTSARQS